jgi:[protein-PII] uridylyltransferase
VDLHNAKINTLGNRAEDNFVISGKQQKALNTAQIAALRDSLAII